MRDIKNPESLFKRSVMNFALAYSACIVVMLVAFLIGRWDTFMALIGSLAFSALFGLVRGAISKPGTRFMDSPVKS